MEFTYTAYGGLLERLYERGYKFANYKNWSEYDRCVILRHDIDYTLDKAVRMAKMETSIIEGEISATYFVLLTSDFYNVFSKRSLEKIKKIVECGHNIGLHFDEARYEKMFHEPDKLCEKILHEVNVLSEETGVDIDTVSMHRPSKVMLDADLKIGGGD